MPKIGIISSIILPPRYENLTELWVQTQPPGCKVAVVFSIGDGRPIAAVCRPIPAHAAVTLARVSRHWNVWVPATFYPSSPSQLAHDVIARFPGRRSDPGAFAGQAVPRG